MLSALDALCLFSVSWLLAAFWPLSVNILLPTTVEPALYYLSMLYISYELHLAHLCSVAELNIIK